MGCRRCRDGCARVVGRWPSPRCDLGLHTGWKARAQFEEGAGNIRRSPRAATCANPLGLPVHHMEVLGLIAQGATDTEIAAQLFLSANTVNLHVSAISASSRFAAAWKADAAAGKLLPLRLRAHQEQKPESNPPGDATASVRERHSSASRGAAGYRPKRRRNHRLGRAGAIAHERERRCWRRRLSRSS